MPVPELQNIDITLRQPESGTGPISSDNDGDVLTYIAATAKWGGRNPAAGAVIVPLSTVLYVDSDTSAPGVEDGSIAHPFSTLQEAVDAADDGFTILVTPGIAGAATWADKSLAIIGLGTSPEYQFVEIGNLTATGFGTVFLQNISANAVDLNADGSLVLDQAVIGGSGGAADVSTLVATDSRILGDVTTLTTCDLWHCDGFGESVTVTAGTTMTVRECDFNGGDALVATTINIDNDSLRSFVFAGGTFTGVVTGYSGALLTWGAISATDTQVFDVGTRANLTTFGDDRVRIFAGHRGVLCRLKGFASAAASALTVQKDNAATALTITCNGAEALNDTTFIEFDTSDEITVRFDGTSGGNADCVATFV